MKREVLAVYPVVDLEHAGAHPEALVAAALRGGATLLQLRDKRDSASELVRVAVRVRVHLEEARVPLVVNDRVEVALAIGADGVHLGQGDLPAAVARARARELGRSRFLIGLSVLTASQAQAAMAAGADYISVSPIFATGTKPDIDEPAGLEGVRAIRRALPEAPLVAIGGIRAARVPEVIAAGADGVAFISALGDPTEAEATVRAMARAVAAGRRARGEAAAERRIP